MLPGSELTKELYRWDQRLFTLTIRIPGFASSVTETSTAPQPEDAPMGNLCEQTGGKKPLHHEVSLAHDDYRFFIYRTAQVVSF